MLPPHPPAAAAVAVVPSMLDGPEMDSDEGLMLAFGRGEAAAFDRLYARHKGALFRYLKRQCGNAATAEELFQDIWLSVVNARERYVVSAKFTTWLFRLAHNRLIDHYRRSGRMPESYASGDDDPAADIVDERQVPVERQLAAQRQCERLLELVDALPAAQREAFLLREEAGLSLSDIAATTGTGMETAKSRLRYAVSALRKGLQAGRGES